MENKNIDQEERKPNCDLILLLSLNKHVRDLREGDVIDSGSHRHKELVIQKDITGVFRKTYKVTTCDYNIGYGRVDVQTYISTPQLRSLGEGLLFEVSKEKHYPKYEGESRGSDKFDGLYQKLRETGAAE